MSSAWPIRACSALALLLAGCAVPEASPDDAHIAADVSERLNQSAALKVDHLRVQVVGRVVYLHGEVVTMLEYFVAEEIAAKTPQVVRVVNLTNLPQNY
jgi:osmotically-inducible protein OsmY